MPAESAAAGERFARDMRRIREARDVTRNDIHEETRIATTLIDAFEKDGLFEHPAFNRVYLRSFVRAYAGCIDLDADTALQHLERALAGEYQNELAVMELGDSPRGTSMQQPKPEDEGETPDPGAPSERPQSGKEREPQAFDPRPIGSTTAETSDASSENEPPVRKPDTSEGREANQKSEGTTTGETKTPTEHLDSPDDAAERDDTETDDTDRHTEKNASRQEEQSVEDKAEPEDAQASEDSDDADTGETNIPDRTQGPSHVADSSVSTSEDARLHTGDVFNKRPMGSGDAGKEEETTTPSPDRRSDVDAPDPEESGGESGEDTTDTSDDEPSPAERFRSMSESDDDSPPPPAHGQMVGRPRPVGSATDSKRSESASSGPASTSPLTERERRDRAERDATGSSANFMIENQRSIMIGGGVVGVLLLVGLIWFLVAGESPETDDPVAQPATADTAAAPERPPTAEPERPPLANPAIGDSINVALRARSDLAGIRIQRDEDQRRPYWMNEGQVVVFPFANQLIIWTQIDSVDIFLEDFPYPSTRDDRGRVVITRDSAATFADTVRGTPTDYAVEPDTVAPDGMGITN